MNVDAEEAALKMEVDSLPFYDSPQMDAWLDRVASLPVESRARLYYSLIEAAILLEQEI